MKKTVAILLALAVVFCAVGQAAAANFAGNDVVLNVYNDDLTGNVIAVDLGLSSGWGVNETVAAAGTVNLIDLNGSWAGASMGIYQGAESWENTTFMAYATTKTTAPDYNNSGLNGFYEGAKTLNSTAQAATSGDVAVYAHDGGTTGTYDKALGANGSMATLNSFDFASGAASLATLIADGFVDMYLYNFRSDFDYGSFGFVATPLPGAGTDYAAVIRLNSDGSVVVNPTTSAVPLPGALVLFASGIVGLIGIRRKNA